MCTACSRERKDGQKKLCVLEKQVIENISQSLVCNSLFKHTFLSFKLFDCLFIPRLLCVSAADPVTRSFPRSLKYMTVYDLV